MKRIILICLVALPVMDCIGATKTRELFQWCSALEKLSEDSSKAAFSDWYNAALCDGYFTGFNDGEYFQYLVSLPKDSAKTGEQINIDFIKSRPWCEPKEGISLQQRYMMFN